MNARLLRGGTRTVLSAPLKLFNAMMMVPGFVIMGIGAVSSMFQFMMIGLVAGCVLCMLVYYPLEWIAADYISLELREEISILFGLFPGLAFGVRAWWLNLPMQPRRNDDTHGSARFASKANTAEFGGASGGLLIGQD